jgi:isopenicillin-N epimerase
MALAARVAVGNGFGTPPTCPDSMIGFMAAVEISEPAQDSRVRAVRPTEPLFLHPLQTVLWRDYRIEIPVTPFPDGRRWNLRLSSAPHNAPEDYEQLVAALGALGYGGR